MATITYTVSQDSYISEWYSQQNFAKSEALFAGRYLQSGDIYRSLIKFDLSNIPPGCTIAEAELQLFMYRNEVGSEPISLEVCHLLSDWNQNTVAWKKQPLFNSCPDGSIFINSDTPAGFQSLDISRLVADWYNGVIVNNGVILRGKESSNALIGFSSSNSELSSQWPRLKVKYIKGTMEIYEREALEVPKNPATPFVESTPIRLGARTMATFMAANASASEHIKIRPQVSYTGNPNGVFFDAGPWQKLEPEGYPGEGISLTIKSAAEYARILIWGDGGETVLVYPRTKDD